MAKNCPNFDRHYHHHCDYLYAARCNDMEVDGKLTFSRNFTKFAQLPNRGQQLPDSWLTRDARPSPRPSAAEKLPEM